VPSSPQHKSIRSTIGIILIVISFLFLGLAFMCGAFALYGSELPWAQGAAVAFVLNWIAFAVGIVLVGPVTARRIRRWLSGSSAEEE